MASPGVYYVNEKCWFTIFPFKCFAEKKIGSLPNTVKVEVFVWNLFLKFKKKIPKTLIPVKLEKKYDFTTTVTTSLQS